MCQAGRWTCGSDIPRGGEEWGGREESRHIVCKTQVIHRGSPGEHRGSQPGGGGGAWEGQQEERRRGRERKQCQPVGRQERVSREQKRANSGGRF